MKTPLFLLVTLISVFHVSSASASCLSDAQSTLLSCRQGCSSSWTEGSRAACAAECNANYYAAKRSCGSSEQQVQDLLAPTERNDDPNCKLITSDSDGRTRVLCMIDGNIWDTWGQCKTYCH